MGEDFNTRIRTVYYSTGPGLTASNIPAYTGCAMCSTDGRSVQALVGATDFLYLQFAGVTREDGLTVGKHGSIVKDGPCKFKVGPGGTTAGYQTTLTNSGKICVWNTSQAGHNFITLGPCEVTAASDDVITHYLRPELSSSELTSASTPID